MEINHLIVVLISLSCLFSFSASHAPSPAPSPLSAISEPPSAGSPASAPSSSDGAQSVSFEVESTDSQTISIMPGSVDPGLQRICGDTDHPIECLTTIAPLLKEEVAIEPVSILKVGIEAMNNKTKQALAAAAEKLADPSTSKEVASCLETCIDNYYAVLECNQKALEAVQIRDLYQLSMELSSNVENVHACEDAFDEANVESPIKETDALLAKMISNSLAIGVDLVHF